jgi:hypothetical protein
MVVVVVAMVVAVEVEVVVFLQEHYLFCLLCVFSSDPFRTK